MFENIPKDFRVEPAYGSNVGSNRAPSSYLKKPLLPETVVSVLPQPWISFMWAWILVTSEIS